MRILVTGATGFVGSHLCGKLKDKHQLGLILRDTSKAARIDRYASNAERLVWDGSAEHLKSLVAGFKPDLVVHLASLFLGTHTFDDVDHLIESNVRFPTVLLAAAKEAGCRFIINTGTSWQHYQNAPFAPFNLYASTKQAFADVLAYYVEVEGFSAITLELTDTYGPDDPRPKLIPFLKKAALDGSTLQMSGGAQYMDLVHIDDIANGFDVVIKELTSMPDSQQRIYMLRSGQAVTLKDFIALFNQISPSPVAVAWGARPYRAREAMEPFKVRETPPGWKPKIALQDGLRQLLEE